MFIIIGVALSKIHGVLLAMQEQGLLQEPHL